MFRVTITVLLVSIMSATALPQHYRQLVNNTCFDFENRFKSSDDFEDYDEYEEYKDERDAVYTVGENIIATTKIRNNYVSSNHSFFQYCDSDIGLFSIAPCKVINFNPFCILFGISSLPFFDGSLSKVIALPTIAIAIVVALSRS